MADLSLPTSSTRHPGSPPRANAPERSAPRAQVAPAATSDRCSVRVERAANVAAGGSAHRPQSLRDAPPLPPRLHAHNAAADERNARAILSLCEESQHALQSGLVVVRTAPATAASAPLPSNASIACMGHVSRMNNEQVSMAFALLSLRGKQVSAASLQGLFDQLADAQAATSERSVAERRAVAALQDKAAATMRQRQWAVSAHEAVGLVATGVFLASGGAAGLALAAVGAALGAAGALALRSRSLRSTGVLRHASAAVHGALLGASVAVLGQPVLAWAAAGAVPGFAAIVGASAHASSKLLYLRTAITATKLSVDMTLAGFTFWASRRQQQARLGEASAGALRTRRDALQQLQDATLDAMQQLVRMRSQSFNQAATLLSRRMQVALRISTQGTH